MLMSHLVLYQKDVVVMDMEAGIEHLGRGTAGAVDAFIVVVEPGVRSIQTFNKVKSMAMDIGVKQVYVIGNKIRNDGDITFLTEKIGAENIIGFMNYRDAISESDRNNQSPYDDPVMKADIAVLGKKIQEIVQEKKK
jgi:CO dehydrogenase maturation factor